jgi:CheY-like chemotaxis protein
MARVPIVDDAAFMRKMLGDVLAKGGHEVIGEGANGAEAITQYQSLGRPGPGVEGARGDQVRRQGLRRQALPARPRPRRDRQGRRVANRALLSLIGACGRWARTAAKIGATDAARAFGSTPLLQRTQAQPRRLGANPGWAPTTPGRESYSRAEL